MDHREPAPPELKLIARVPQLLKGMDLIAVAKKVLLDLDRCAAG